MTTRNENLQDKHLQKALQHAPDSEVAPSEFARKAVLEYADKSLKTRHKIKQISFFARAIKAFNDWQLPRWKMAGMGSLAASLLVVVMIWHENPDDPLQVDPIQVATAPEAASSAESRYETKSAENELAKDDAAKNAVIQAEQAIAESAPVANEPAVASAESTAANLQDKVTAKAKSAKSEAQAVPQAAAIGTPADKTVPARAAESASTQALEKGADSTSANEAAVTAEVAAESAPAVPTAPAAVLQTEMDDNAASTEQTSAEQKSEAEKPAAVSKRSAVLPKIGATKAQGIAKAKQDIQAGVLRILATEWPANKLLVDEATGYHVQVVKDLAAEELAAYNQTMRDWYMEKK